VSAAQTFRDAGDTPAATVSLHDFPRENVELTFLPLAHLGDFVRSRFIATDDRALLRRSIAGGKFDNYARTRAATKMKHLVGQFCARPQNGAVRIGKIDDELSA